MFCFVLYDRHAIALVLQIPAKFILKMYEQILIDAYGSVVEHCGSDSPAGSVCCPTLEWGQEEPGSSCLGPQSGGR